MLEVELPVALADQAFTPAGELADPELAARLEGLLGQLAPGNLSGDERVQHGDRAAALGAV